MSTVFYKIDLAIKNITTILFSVIVMSLITIQPANAACRQALVLALDVSGSVDDREYFLQRNGLADALLNPEVQELILNQPLAPISLAVFEWSSNDHQQLIQNWTEITSVETLRFISNQIRSHRKNRATLKTAIGAAVKFASALLDQKQSCWKRTIDISGDGINNDGITPKNIYKALGFKNITVNGLIVGIPTTSNEENPIFKGKKDLKAYYDAEIIHGTDAFSIRANGYDDYARAMKMKLLKEISPPSVSKSAFSVKSPFIPL